MSEAWEIKEVVLDLTLLMGSHTGKNLAEAFHRVLEDFGILEKLLAITSDNASNMDAFMREFSSLAGRKLC